MDEISSSPGGAGSTNPSQSVISQRVWGLHTVRGGIDPGDHRFRPRFVGGADVWKDYDQGMGPYPPGVALALRTPGWGPTPCGAVSTRGTAVFVPSLSELQIYGRILSGDGALSFQDVAGP